VTFTYTGVKRVLRRAPVGTTFHPTTLQVTEETVHTVELYL
jgi:hypothetical protein